MVLNERPNRNGMENLDPKKPPKPGPKYRRARGQQSTVPSPPGGMPSTSTPLMDRRASLPAFHRPLSGGAGDRLAPSAALAIGICR